MVLLWSPAINFHWSRTLPPTSLLDLPLLVTSGLSFCNFSGSQLNILPLRQYITVLRNSSLNFCKSTHPFTFSGLLLLPSHYAIHQFNYHGVSWASGTLALTPWNSWNSLPPDIHDISSLPTFKPCLKPTFLLFTTCYINPLLLMILFIVNLFY